MKKLFLLMALAALPASAQFGEAAARWLPASCSVSGLEVRATEAATASNGARAVLLLHAEICRQLAVTSPPPRLAAWFTDAAAWSNFCGQAGAGLEGRGLSCEDAVAVMAVPDDANEALAHELVHLVLKRTSSSPLPLWFEEGCAAFYGWRAAQAVAKAERGSALVRTLPALNPAELNALNVLLGYEKYTGSRSLNRAFYRQSEELVRLLHERIGDAGLRRLARQLSVETGLFECLRSGFDYSPGDLELLKETVSVRSTTRQEH